jgi:hypothetical protein
MIKAKEVKYLKYKAIIFYFLFTKLYKLFLTEIFYISFCINMVFFFPTCNRYKNGVLSFDFNMLRIHKKISGFIWFLKKLYYLFILGSLQNYIQVCPYGQHNGESVARYTVT